MNPTGASSLLALLERNVRVRDAAVKRWAESLPPNSRVLDIGAGTCGYRRWFAHCAYVAHDHPGSTMAPASVVTVRSDVADIPLDGASIDAILCTEVLEHVEEPLRAVNEFARLLRPGGQLLLSVPSACRVHRVPTHYYGGFAPDFFEHSLPSRGLRLERLEPIGNWSTFMAQELGRTPDLVRNHSAIPKPLARIVAALAWPFFRVAAPLGFLALAKVDQSADLPLGWLAYATRASP